MNGIDPRGPRFGAAVTSAVLVLALILPVPWSTGAAIVQWLVFAVGAVAGMRYQPWGVIFRVLVRPRLTPPTELEDPRAPRFAQSVGMLFLSVALVGWASDLTIVYLIFVGAALAAALLNAVFDLCLGCEMYVRLQRLKKRPTKPLEAVGVVDNRKEQHG